MFTILMIAVLLLMINLALSVSTMWRTHRSLYPKHKHKWFPIGVRCADLNITVTSMCPDCGKVRYKRRRIKRELFQKR